MDGLAGFYLDDPRAQICPALAQTSLGEGARASGMVSSSPTVTWPNHTTLVTGASPAQHGVLGDHGLDRQTGKNVALIMDPNFDKDQIVKLPTIYDVAHDAGAFDRRDLLACHAQCQGVRSHCARHGRRPLAKVWHARVAG